MSTLSVLYVVRNEEGCIPKSIYSVVEIADEIVVIDTGSSDRTVHLCRQIRGVRVIRHSWVHDFSKTKNFGLENCTKEWVLCMDADELLDPASASAVKAAVRRAAPNVGGFALRIVDHEVTWEPHAGDTGGSFFPSPQVRVFRRAKGVRFSGTVQESVRDSVLATGKAIDIIDARLHHFLWRGRGQEYAEKKLQYYKRLGSALDMAGARSPEPEPSAPGVVAIVVVCFNGLQHTKACLESVIRNTTHPYAIYPVDNGSQDATSTYVLQLTSAPPLSFKRNEGVAKGRNLGARQALRDPAVKYVCFLDNDTNTPPGWLDGLVSVAERDSGIWLVGPLSNQAAGAQAAGDIHKDGPEALAAALEDRDPEWSEADRIDGFCMLARASALRQVGFFDESFGLYGNEDEDLCRRVVKAGGKIAVANRVFVEHEGGATLKCNKMNWHPIMLTSAQRFRKKWKIDTREAREEAPVPSPVRSTAGPKRYAQGGYSHPATSIVVLTHNRLDVTKEFLEALVRHTRNYELIVVDNGSTDGTREWLASKTNMLTLIENSSNLGVPSARNQGLRAARHGHIAVMDNDVIVRPGWLDDMHKVMAQQGADVIGLEAWQVNSDWCAYKKCVSGYSEHFDYLGGACCLFRRRVFEEAGLLDEGFSPAYYEDVDICYRAKKKGLKLAWHPGAKMSHKEHSTLVYGQTDFGYQEALARSQERFSAKMRGELKVEHEYLPPANRSLKILYLGMEFDYGVRERGLSFEHNTFWPSLNAWSGARDVIHFDFVELGKRHGVPKMSDMLYDAVQEHCPDAVFFVPFDEHHDPRRQMLEKIGKTTPAKTIGWFCDSHWRYERFDKPWAAHLDFCVTTSTVAYEKYGRDGLGSKAIKSQWAASPKYKKFEVTHRDIDCSFVGQPHGDRRKVVAAVQRAGIQLSVYGTGWGNRLSFEQMVETFNKSKINLNLANSCDAQHAQIKGRNFEVPACGGFLLTGKAENLYEYYKYGEEIVTFDNTNDMIDKIRYYAAHQEERERIAAAGYQRTMRDHTYSNRLDHVFARARLI